MGIIDKVIKKKLDKIRENSPYEYNSLITPNRTIALQDRYTRNMLINSTWYGGNDLELKQLYERDLKSFRIGQFTSEELNYFWAQPTSGTNVRKIHSGIPQLISEKMVDLLISNGYEITVYADDELEEQDEDNQKRLEEILEYNNFSMLLPEAIETESWSGGVPFKLSASKKYKYPILEVVQPEEYEPTVEAGRIVADTFIKYFNKGALIFKLKETYSFDDSNSYITYKLYKLIANEWLSAELSDCEETKDLVDVIIKGVTDKFSIYKPNKLPNSEFRNSKLGESDYSGSHGLFDALDEIISALIQEFRDGKIIKWWPSSLLPVDPTTQVAYMPPTLKKDFVSYNTGIGEKEKPTTPTMTQGEIHSEKYLESFKKVMESVLNNAGLSPQTIGLSGLESTAASEESQELREKTSIRTRGRKISLWIPTLNKLFELLLQLDDIKNGRSPQPYMIRTVFNDYKIKTLADKTNEASVGLASGSWDLKSAIDYVHDELTEEEKVLMRVNIKIEKGIAAFTKEEELIYRKYVQDVVEEQPEPLNEVVEDEEVEIDDEQELVEEEVEA